MITDHDYQREAHTVETQHVDTYFETARVRVVCAECHESDVVSEIVGFSDDNHFYSLADPSILKSFDLKEGDEVDIMFTAKKNVLQILCKYVN